MKRQALLFGVVLAVILIGGACRKSVTSDKSAIQRAFSSFIYVGEAYGTRSYPGVGEHATQVQRFPDLLAVGHQYVFRRPKSTGESWTVLEAALRTNGATIIDAPHNHTGLVYTYVGGPWFVIRFKIWQIQGTVQNYPAKELDHGRMAGDLEPVDFVLTIS